MDIQAAIASAERTLQKVKEQEDKTLGVVKGMGLGKEAEQKIKESFRETIANAEIELKRLKEQFKK